MPRNNLNLTLIFLRILRALLGVLGLIMLKASIQPGFEYFIDGEAGALTTLAGRLLVGVLAIALFDWLRTYINDAYIARGLGSGPLRAIWTL